MKQGDNKKIIVGRDGRISGGMVRDLVVATLQSIGCSVVDLAEVEQVAAIIHHGSMDDVMSTGQALARWIDASGYHGVGYAREVTVEWSPDPGQWVTELQHPIDATGG